MNREEKVEQLRAMLGESNDTLLNAYLQQSKSKILNKLYPFKTDMTSIDVPDRYAQLQIELAITLYNTRGAEGQSSHNENGVNRSWRSETEILAEITPFAGLPL